MAKKLKIGIIGTRGIPNRYGGFESFAEQLSTRLVGKGHRVTVFCSRDQQYQEPDFSGVALSYQVNPEKWMGSAGQFIYDLKSNLATRTMHFDIVLHLGYTSDAIWRWLWDPVGIHIVNMDGMEWQRAKFPGLVRNFLRWSEKQAVLGSHFLIADSPVIEKYLNLSYCKPVKYISYGAIIPKKMDENHLHQFNLQPFTYDIAVARMEPENNIETIIRSKVMENADVPLILFSNHTKYGDRLKKRYGNEHRVWFMEPLYERGMLDSLRYFSRFYIHGHSAGGTNPSLLEAMACECRLLCHDNLYNKAVTHEHALYFQNENDLKFLLNDRAPETDFRPWISQNLEKIKHQHSWESITDTYEELFYKVLESR